MIHEFKYVWRLKSFMNFHGVVKYLIPSRVPGARSCPTIVKHVPWFCRFAHPNYRHAAFALRGFAKPTPRVLRRDIWVLLELSWSPPGFLTFPWLKMLSAPRCFKTHRSSRLPTARGLLWATWWHLNSIIGACVFGLQMVAQAEVGLCSSSTFMGCRFLRYFM